MQKETITFSQRKLKPVDQVIAPTYQDAILKYCFAVDLPVSAPKNHAFYTLDTHALYHGNGPELPLSRITNEKSVTKDIVIMMYNVSVGRVEPEIIFPYVGKMKSIQLVPDSNVIIAQRIIADLEVQKDGVWSSVCRLHMNAATPTVTEDLHDIVVDNQLLRLNVIDIQDDINYLVAHIKIDLV